MLGKRVKVIVDRPLGSYHPKYKELQYPLNYGYIEGVIAADGEEQDAYILGVNEPTKEFSGKVIAIIHRFDDVEEKLVVAPEGASFTKDEIMKQVNFQEQFFKIEIRTQIAAKNDPKVRKQSEHMIRQNFQCFISRTAVI